MKARAIARFALLTALALILGYLESLIPIFPQAPGIKLGLSNLVLLYAIYRLNAWQTILLMLLKVSVSGLLFSGFTGAMYGLCGGLLSVSVMLLLLRIPHISVVTVSASGGVCHNIGQMVLACFLLTPRSVLAYSPILLAAGLALGILLGFVAKGLLAALDRYERRSHS